MPDPEILIQTHGPCGLITLNRPAALNALTHGMVRAIAAALDQWEADPLVTRVVIEANGGKAFCAGGDIRALYGMLKAGQFEAPLQFWADEYRLNQRIKRYPKPYIAIVDGIVMGGGAGISINGSHVVAGDNFRFAMPEVGIGFFPDVGATHFLSHLPGHWGRWLALTGAQIQGDIATRIGLARAKIASGDLPALRAELLAGADVEVLMRESGPPPLPPPQLPGIDDWFSGAGMAEILRLVDSAAATAPMDDRLAFHQGEILRQKSPTSLAIALRQMQLGRSLTFEQALQTEFRIVSRLIHAPDFIEGIRAAVIDKDRAPKWSPGSIHEVRADNIDAYFAPLPDGDLDFAAKPGKAA